MKKICIFFIIVEILSVFKIVKIFDYSEINRKWKFLFIVR